MPIVTPPQRTPAAVYSDQQLAVDIQPLDPAVALTAQRAVLEPLVMENPVTTMQRITELSTSAATREGMLAITAAAWARHDPNAAAEWVRRLADGERKRRLMSTVAFE